MPDESTTPDLVELTRRQLAALNRGDVQAQLSFLAPDVSWEIPSLGLRLDGVAAIRAFWEDFLGAYEAYEAEAQEILDLGKGVAFTVILARTPRSR